MSDKMLSDRETLGCLYLLILCNLAPILIALIAHILWANKITLFLFWVFIIIGLVLFSFVLIGLIAMSFKSEKGK